MGNAYIDRREWGEYNESLVEWRGPPGFRPPRRVDGELKRMNGGKEGAPFRYPEPFHEAPRTPERLLPPHLQAGEGFVRSISKYVEGLEVPAYSTISERTQSLDMTLEGLKTDRPIPVVLDSSGIKVTNSEDWRGRNGR